MQYLGSARQLIAAAVSGEPCAARDGRAIDRNGGRSRPHALLCRCHHYASAFTRLLVWSCASFPPAGVYIVKPGSKTTKEIRVDATSGQILAGQTERPEDQA